LRALAGCLGAWRSAAHAAASLPVTDHLLAERELTGWNLRLRHSPRYLRSLAALRRCCHSQV